MKFKGEGFNYFVEGKSVTKEEVKDLIHSNMTVTVDGVVVNFVSPKKKKEDIRLTFEELQYLIVNDNTTEKDFADTVYLITAKNKQELGQRFAEVKLKNAEKEETKNSCILLYGSCGSIQDIVDKDSTPKKDKIAELLEEADKHQEQNGVRVEGVEFPFDAVLTPPKYIKKDLEWREKQVFEDWNKNVVVYDVKLPIYGEIGRPIDTNFHQFGAEKEGIKETENKVDYGELDFDYIDGMALRMTKNLAKYPPKNWQKKIEIKELAKSAMRHARKILQEIDGDEETLQDHAIALGNNGMMINFQLKSKNNLK